MMNPTFKQAAGLEKHDNCMTDLQRGIFETSCGLTRAPPMVAKTLLVRRRRAAAALAVDLL
jgi:hypothetical protein